MTTTSSRFFDELAKLMTSAAGAAQGVRREIDTLVQTQVERVLNNLDMVKREEFEAVKAMAQKAREENDALAASVSPNSKPTPRRAPNPASCRQTRAPAELNACGGISSLRAWPCSDSKPWARFPTRQA